MKYAYDIRQALLALIRLDGRSLAQLSRESGRGANFWQRKLVRPRQDPRSLEVDDVDRLLTQLRKTPADLQALRTFTTQSG